MCGRWATPYTKENIERHYKLSVTVFKPSYNIVPGTANLVITKEREKKAELMQWGMVPYWAKDPKIGYRMINARSETLLEKPSFRRPFTSGRCLIPAGGFYEWRKTDGGKIPYYIHLRNASLFSFAGLFDRWKKPDGTELRSFTIITTTPNSIMAPIHDRMPVIISREYEDYWLGANSPQNLVKLLRPYDNEANMEAYPISTKVNDPSNNSEELLARLS